MNIWDMTQAEFVGVIPVQGFPAPGMNDWANLSTVLLPQMPPDLQTSQTLTGLNSAYVLTSVRGLPGQFIAHLKGPSGFQPVGLYDDTVIVLDPAHTRRWLAEELVIAACSIRQQVPNTSRQLTSASEKTFKRAHELAVRRAHARLEAVHPANVMAYNLPSWP